MATLRRYVFAFVAVCVAFAVGIALGNGPLQKGSSTDDTAAITHANQRLGDRVAALRAGQVFPEALAQSAGAAVLHGLLSSGSVGVVVLPGVSATSVSTIADSVKSAGAELVWTMRIDGTVVDPTRKTYAQSVATNTAKGLTDLGTAGGSSSYGLLGRLLARAYTGPSSALGVDSEATQIDAQLRGAKVLTLAPSLARRADAVIVLAPGEHGQGDTAVYALHQIEAQLVTGLASRCDGLLLATPPGGSAPGGLLTDHAVLSGPNAIATVNLLGTPSAAIAAVGGLASVLDGHPGSYGVIDGRAVVPPDLQPVK